MITAFVIWLFLIPKKIWQIFVSFYKATVNGFKFLFIPKKKVKTKQRSKR